MAVRKFSYSGGVVADHTTRATPSRPGSRRSWGRGALVLTKTTVEILEILAAHSQRMSDSRH
jgi:hypothetical protein